MKKLLTILGTIALVGTTSINIVACGTDKIQPYEENNKIQSNIDSLNIAQNKINSLFGNLIKEKKNILRPTNFGDYGKLLLDSINKISDNQEITNPDLTEKFYKVIKDNISDFGDKLRNDVNLKSIFSGINVNEILTLNTEKSTITKLKFDEWKNDKAFGINNYKKEDYNIKAWNLLKLNLKLNLKWKDMHENILDSEISIDFFDINFINQDANPENVIKKSQENINNQLKKDDIITTNLKLEWNLSRWWENNDLNLNILEKIKNKLKSTIKDKLKFNNYQLPDNKNNCSVTQQTDWEDSGYFARKVFLNQKGSYVRSSFTEKANLYANEFEDKINKWEHKSKILKADLQKVSFVGKYEINSWTYNNLTLEPIEIPVIIIDNMSRQERIDDTANKLAQICSIDGIWNNRLTISSFHGNFTMKMNQSDFENYQNYNFGDTIRYLQDKTINLAKNKNIFMNNDSLKLYNFHELSKLGSQWQNTPLKDKLKDNKYIINMSSTAIIDIWMSFNGYSLSLAYSSVPNYTVIKGDNNSVWN